MCRTQCLLALVTLYVGLVHSWDIAVSLGDELVFYTNGSKTDTILFKFQNLTALAYDDVHDTMLYVDKQSDFEAICGYNLLSMENKCFIERLDSNIHSIAFDPATDTLFFLDTKSMRINWVSLKPVSRKRVNLLVKLYDPKPNDIAVDSCRGYIYWSIRNSLVRGRLNGSEKETLRQTPPLFSMTMDPQTRKIYYLEGYSTRYLVSTDLTFSLESVNIELDERYHSEPKELTVSNDYLYWMNSKVNSTTVWYLPKNTMGREEPKEMTTFDTKRALCMAANYKIKDEIQGLQDCQFLWSLKPEFSVTNNSLNIQKTTETEQTTEYARVEETFCVHGIKVNETSVCKCTPGYIGGRCDVSVCENYCLQGDCSFNDEGLRKCRCNAGYSGERCEVYACHGFCLNNGDCSLTEEDEPVCRCADNYEGIRCEAVKDVTINNIPMYDWKKKNLTLADILSNWRKPISKMFVTMEV